ncbi:MAG: phosphoribosylformylglycinamidine cyclo-ligase, partial [Planctomycetota bacterium]
VDPQKAHSLLQNILPSLPHYGPLPGNFFCQLYPFNQDEYLVMATDGVGTKILLALEFGYLEEIGYDLVAMVYNDMITSGAKGLAFLDYYSTGHLDQKVFPVVLKSIIDACQEAGMDLLGGETAEMPGLYKEGDFDLAGFGVGRVEKEKLLGPHRVQEGDLLVGIPASGFHSNGYSLIRKVLKERNLDLQRIYTFDDISMPLGKHLLKGTRIYSEVQRLWEDQKISLSACAHITGGGIYENLPRILPPGMSACLKEETFPGLEILQWFQEIKGLSLQETVSIFHGGYGMILAVPESGKESVKQHFPHSKTLGWIEKGDSPIVWVK